MAPSIPALRCSAPPRGASPPQWLARQCFKRWMPKGLYARALLIIIVPMVMLQSVIAYVFHGAALEHGDAAAVSAVVHDIAR